MLKCICGLLVGALCGYWYGLKIGYFRGGADAYRECRRVISK